MKESYKNRSIRIINLLFLLVITIILTSCNKHNYKIASKSYYLYLDTISSVSIEYDAKTKTLEQITKELDYVETILFNIECEFSADTTYYMKNEGIIESTLMKVNNKSGIEAVEVSDEFINILKQAKEISEITDGGFDVSIGPLTSLWDISSQSEYCSIEEPNSSCHIPNSSDIDYALSLIDYKSIQIDEENKTVFLPKRGMKLDFGGIAKGYAADIVMAYLKTLNYEYISVNLGGNLIVSGISNIYKARNEKVMSEIQNPYGANTIIKTDETDMTIVSSGTYERYIYVDGKTYHHILSPKNGYPFENELVMVSLIGKSSCISDGLSTGIFSLGLDEGMKAIEEMDGYSAFFITAAKEIYVVGDISFELTETGQNEYKIKE